MSKESEAPDGPDELFSGWMKSTGKAWENVFQFWQSSAEAFTPRGDQGKDPAGRVRKSMDVGMKTMSAMASAMAEPEAVESLLKGVGAMPDLLAKAAMTSMSGFMRIQEKVFEQAGRIGKSAETYSFEELDETIFRTWAEIYETEFQQFFKVPQLGLTRLHQERWLRASDKLNIYQTTLAEFLRLLQLPVSRSFTILQEDLAVMAEKSTLPEDSKIYYQMWIKILEGLYMKLFQSPEYVNALGQTLDSMSKFTMARNEVIEDMLGSLPIPKQKDVDELAHEIYLLKKRVKALEKAK